MTIGVAFIIGSFHRGGAERDLLELIRGLDRRRFDLHVFSASEDGDLREEYVKAEVPLLPLGIPGLRTLEGLRGVRRARAYLRQNDVRVLQGFGDYGSFYAAVIARGVPGVSLVSYQFTAGARQPLRARLARAYALRRCEVVVGNSDAVLRAVSKERWGRGPRLLRIYNGIDPRLFAGPDGDLREPLPALEPGAPLVGAIGRLHPIKGHAYLVAAWPEVLREEPRARLLLAGPAWPHQREAIERCVREAGCEGRVHLLGLRRDVPALLRRLDLVVVPSLAEGFANVVLEAGAAGLPVVATRVGGNPEAIEEGRTGLLVPPRDPGALAGAILALLADAGLRRRMGEQARRRVTTLFPVQEMVASYDRLYTSLAGGAA